MEEEKKSEPSLKKTKLTNIPFTIPGLQLGTNRDRQNSLREQGGSLHKKVMDSTTRLSDERVGMTSASKDSAEDNELLRRRHVAQERNPDFQKNITGEESVAISSESSGGSSYRDAAMRGRNRQNSK